MKTLAGKSALVTGGGGGFGKACAQLLVRDGAAVTLMGRTLAKLEAARQLLLDATPGAAVALCAGDAADEADVQAAIEATRRNGGGVDIVVATVGGGSGYAPVSEASLDGFLHDYRVNVGSAFLAVRHAAPQMHDGGSIVLISSTAARLAFVKLAGYCAAKAGLDQFMRVAANELGSRRIRVNCVRPGLTHTDGMDAAFSRPGYTDSFLPLIPLGRTGAPNDVAEAVRYLAGPEAAWVTGQSFAVDGGNELRMAPL
jgi:NAD(P)-dependent dehydrogenase (short-subunit alcohol dehydrogenase family)